MRDASNDVGSWLLLLLYVLSKLAVVLLKLTLLLYLVLLLLLSNFGWRWWWWFVVIREEVDMDTWRGIDAAGPPTWLVVVVEVVASGAWKADVEASCILMTILFLSKLTLLGGLSDSFEKLLLNFVTFFSIIYKTMAGEEERCVCVSVTVWDCFLLSENNWLVYLP